MIKYSKTHEYVKVEGEYGYIGVSDYAQKELGNVVYVDMQEIGDELEAGEDFGAIESVKAAYDRRAPVSGGVVETNEAQEEDPRLGNADAMANWIVKVKIADPAELDSLMDEAQYAEYIRK